LLPESSSVRLTRLYPGSTIRPTVRAVVVPAPSSTAIIPWVVELIRSVILGEEFEKDKSENLNS
jgi:transcription-repair coupling factor (superfamily II helicase)